MECRSLPEHDGRRHDLGRARSQRTPVGVSFTQTLSKVCPGTYSAPLSRARSLSEWPELVNLTRASVTIGGTAHARECHLCNLRTGIFVSGSWATSFKQFMARRQRQRPPANCNPACRRSLTGFTIGGTARVPET